MCQGKTTLPVLIKGNFHLSKRQQFNFQHYGSSKHTPLDVMCIIRSSESNRKVSIQELFGRKNAFGLETNLIFSYIGPPNTKLKMKSVCMMKINIHNTLQKNDLKETPLHRAVTNQNIDAVKFLVKQNITLEIKNIDGDTPLHYASSLGNLDIVKVLTQNLVSNT